MNKEMCKQWSWKLICSCWLLVAVGLGITGCGKRAALEDRTYVETIHITPVTGGYQYRCTLAYMDAQAMESLGMGSASDKTAGTGENQSNGSDSSSAQSAGEEVADEYVATAEDIEDFNREYARITGSQLDYSHLQGIYLTEGLYNAAAAEDVLEDIREETQAVLSTPVYQEGVAIGDQSEKNMGDWLKR